MLRTGVTHVLCMSGWDCVTPVRNISSLRNMEWSEELTLQFIEVYRSKVILWDTKQPSYYNEIKKNDAWDELAEDFKTTVDDCKRKVNNLLSALRREKAKMKKTLGTGCLLYTSRCV